MTENSLKYCRCVWLIEKIAALRAKSSDQFAVCERTLSAFNENSSWKYIEYILQILIQKES